MKSLDEIESILKQSYSDPIVRMAAEEIVRQAENVVAMHRPDDKEIYEVAMAKGFLEGVRATEERDNARD